MPWRATTVMNEKLVFIAAYLERCSHTQPEQLSRQSEPAVRATSRGVVAVVQRARGGDTRRR